MEMQLDVLGSPELTELYHKTDLDIRQKLVDGCSWEAVKEDTILLTTISKELAKRKISLKNSAGPAETQLR